MGNERRRGGGGFGGGRGLEGKEGSGDREIIVLVTPSSCPIKPEMVEGEGGGGVNKKIKAHSVCS